MDTDEPQSSETQPPPKQLRVGDLLVDLERCQVRRGTEPLDLPDRSFRLLETLIRHAPEQVGKDELIAEVWDDAVVSDETLAQRVRLLRQSLGDDSQKPTYIASVRGRGYRLVAPVSDVAATQSVGGAGIRVIAAVAALVGIALVWQLLSTPPPESSSGRAGVIAVLPFADMSADQNHQFFADGMHEELLSRLAMIDELSVISRTSVERFRGSNAGLPEIAEQLGADAIIEGSVRVDDERLRVTVQLIDAVSDDHIWASNFDRELSVQDIFGLQTDVASQIAAALELEYVQSVDDGVRLPTDSIEAYNAYLLGRFHMFKQTRSNLEQAVTYLERATELDPQFALAFASLGWAYSFHATEYGTRLPAEMYPKAKEAALRAITLDGSLADARTLYADILTWYDWDFAAAEREYLKTIELDPLNVLGYALFLSTQERHAEAIAVIERRIAAQPDDPYVCINAGWRYFNAGENEKAIVAGRAAPDHPDSTPLIGWSRLAQGNTDAAIAVFEGAMDTGGRTARNAANLAVAYYRAGRTAEADALLAELEEFASDNYVSADMMAGVYFAAGNPDRGFELLEESYQRRNRGMIFLKVSETLREYRDDPRYLSLIERVGL